MFAPFHGEMMVPVYAIRDIDVRGLWHTIFQPIRGVWARYGIVLAIQVTILGVASIAKVWPKPMQRPLVCG